jgi:hypothetical protein
MALVVAAGLLWRSGMIPLPSFHLKYGGDALWALLIFLGFGFLFIRVSTLRAALMACCFCSAVEFTQLYHAPWIDAVRGTRLGGLVLGATFNWPDLIAYGAGIILGCLAEIILRRGARS